MRATRVASTGPDDLTDAELIEASGSAPELFGFLFDRHVDAIHAYVHRRLGPQMAEELTAETFARAFASRQRFVAIHTDAAPWLYGIATNLIHHAKRAERRQLQAYAKAAGAAVPVTEESGEADERLDARRVAPRLVGALLELEPGDRDALLLFAWEDLSYKDVATALGIPVGTVASRINRARRHVRASLGSSDDTNGEEL